MTANPPTITYTLEEFLSRFEQKIDRQFAEVNQKMDRQFAEVNQKFSEVNQKMDRQFTEINQKLEKIDDRLSKLEIGQEKLSGAIKALDEKFTGEIKTLDEKVSGISKRLDNQEFINRGILVSVIIALIGGAAKLFDVLPSQ